MILRGTHLTTYTYDAPVTLEMHTVRLQPRSGSDQFLRAFDIRVSPAPAAQTQAVDAEGNAVSAFWFLGQTNFLAIETRFEVENRRANPFDFIPAATSGLPPQLSPDEGDLLSPCMKKEAQPEIDSLSQTIAASCDGSAFGFALAANAWIFENIGCVYRQHGLPLQPTTTLAEKRGACRDQAVLLMALCRAQGLPARFASGYLLREKEAATAQDLHAWTEVWIPGGGWRGLDPTQGLATTDHYVAVAASAVYAMAAPVTGSYRGNVFSRLPTHAIELNTV